jgi:hypothetical protein
MVQLDKIPRLEKLLLLLSSNQPGEVVAAASAIQRALKAAGASWHDLARGLTQPAAPSPRARKRDRSDQDADWHELHDFCRSRDELLAPRELDFMNTLDHWHGNLTPKQRAWLEGIHSRLRRTEF